VRKVVINIDYGGFSLSHKAVMRYSELSGIPLYPYLYGTRDDILKPFQEDTSEMVHHMMVCYLPEQVPEGTKWQDVYKKAFDDRAIKRSDPYLVQVVEELGDKANGKCAELEVVELEEGAVWQIKEHAGQEELITSTEWNY
jgi:hypothetical protein